MPKSRAPSPVRPSFTPVATRARHDGWTPDKQVGFVEALAESGCVAEASAAVGISTQSAYRLRMRVDAQGFRIAWDAALDLAIRRLSDACYSRALQGEIVPHFFGGEQVGEHRRYDNRLAMFLLRYRDPLRYAATLDQMVYAGHPETAAIAFAKARDRVHAEAHGVFEPDEPDDSDEAPPGTPPYAVVSVQQELARQKEQALVESNAPIGGSHARRWDITQKRRRHHALMASAAAGGAVDPDSGYWPADAPCGPRPGSGGG